MLAVPGLLPFSGHSADGTTIRNVLYGIVLAVAGLLVGVYGVLSYRRKMRAASAKGGANGADGGVTDGNAGSADGSAASATGGAGAHGGANGAYGGAGTGGAGSAAGGAGAFGAGNGTTATSIGAADTATVPPAQRTTADALAEAATLGGTAIPDTRIMRLPRTALDDSFRRACAEGCAWLDVAETPMSELPAALLIPTRAELFDYLASHFPAQTVMMSDHIANGSGLPYFVNGGVHLHCALVKNSRDMGRMLSTYNPQYPLACVLVSGAMNLDSRASEAEQLATIRQSVIGLVWWHAERGEYELVCDDTASPASPTV